MRSNFNARAQGMLLTVALLAIPAPYVRAQETEARVIDEVVVQVNNDVITLSMIKREIKEAVTSMTQQGKSEQEATDEMTRRQPELIANLINEQLLMAQGKELGLADEVEAEVNRRMLEVAKGQGIKSIDELKKVMQANSFDYDAVRQTMRKEIMKGAVLSRDVDAKIFFGLNDDELKKYFEAHKDKFQKPDSVTLSEIFLSLAGKSEAEVKAKADQLVAQARSGGDFAALAAANSERLLDGKPIAAETKGKVGTFRMPDLRDNIAAAIKDVKSGGVTDPLRYDEGFQILRVDERIAGSNVPTYNENQARELITAERGEAARKEYMQKLRKEAVIKFNERYRADVMPFLTGATAVTSSTSQPPSTDAGADKKPTTNGSKP